MHPDCQDAALAKYIEAHPNLTKTQFRDLLDRRPDFVNAFDKHPEELMKVGRAPALSLMLNQYKELKATRRSRPRTRARGVVRRSLGRPNSRR